MRKKIGFGTLESRIYIIITVMLFTAIFIMQLVFFRFVTTTITSSTLENNRTLLRQLVTQIDSYIAGVEKVSELILDDDNILEYLEFGGSHEEVLKIKEKLFNYKQARTDISNILLYNHDGKIILDDPNASINRYTSITDSQWYKNAIKEEGLSAVSSSYVQNIISGQYSWVVSLSREIFSNKTGKSVGVILVDLKFNRIDELCKSLIIGKRGYDFIIDTNGDYIYHPTQQLINSNLRHEPIRRILDLIGSENNKDFYLDQKYYMVESSGLTGWNIVSVTHKSDIITDWKNIQLIYTLIGFMLFLFVGPITKRISSGITKPVRQLQNIMKTVEYGEFNLIGPIKATDEIRTLAYDYDIMVGRIKELMETNNKDQELKRKSDLIALQAQINPHFLYNTLDSIIWMGEMGHNKEVVKMTSALSKLFRISISKGHEIITIRDEIAHVQSYLTIQGMRYQEKFSYLIDIEPELHQYPIIKITLQPIVENAIYHGIKENGRMGFIKISSKIYNSNIQIDISDNGVGMNETEVNNLIENINSDKEDLIQDSKYGMGLRNVHQRLRLYFGEEYGLSFNSVVGKGTTATITIPALMLGKKT